MRVVDTTRTRPLPQEPEPPKRGLAARVSLGRVFAPVPSEFLLIASTALILTGFGLVMVLSATSATSEDAGGGPYDAVIKQGVFAVIGIPLMFLASRMPLRFWKRMAWPALIGATVFQLLVFTPLGITNDGNQNWIRIAGLQAQPSEFLKVTLAIWLGYILYRKRTLLADWRHVFIPAVPVGIAVIGTVMAGHDLGTAIILVLIMLAGLFFSGVKLRVFLLPLRALRRRRRVLRDLEPRPHASIHELPLQRLPRRLLRRLLSAAARHLGTGRRRTCSAWAWVTRKRSTAGCPPRPTTTSSRFVGEELGLIGCIVVLTLFAIFDGSARYHIVRKTVRPVSCGSPPVRSRSGSSARRC